MKLPSWAGRIALLCCAVLMTVGVTRSLFVQGLFLPVRVSGGSMAPSLLGAHWDRQCEKCGYQHSFGTEFPPDEVGVVCPNCGAICEDFASTAGYHRGQRVLIDRLSLSLRPPRRWEVVAFRRSDGQLAVKRVVGLPAEQVSLRDGDIYVDGRIVRKPWRVTQAQSIPVNTAVAVQGAVAVHTNPCRDGTPRWRPEDPKSNWRATIKGYQYSAAASETTGEIDYLVYHHLACLPPPTGNSPAPILDSYGYNQSLSRKLFRVTDVILEASVAWQGSGAIILRILAGEELYELLWRPSVDSVSLRNRDGVLASASKAVAVDRTARITFAFVDQQILFVIDGKTVMQYDVTHSGAENPYRDSMRPQSPFAIGVQGFSLVDCHDIQVLRDVYYVDAPGVASTWQLGNDEFLALGDNSPISQDARQGSEFGIVTLDRIVGRVVPQHTRWLDR